jgi:nucleotide-binding universal stress UspA family protein
MPDRVVRRILVPVELSEREPPDTSYALRLAAQLGAELVLFVVIDTPTIVALIGRHRAVQSRGESFHAALVADAKKILQEIVDAAAKLGVHALGHATVGEQVVELILKEALVQKVDLILVRSRTPHGLMAHLLGSTAGEILDAAPCPVLVSRPREP